MVEFSIDLSSDPTLTAIDAELERRENAQQLRSYLGMSGLGGACERRIWYAFRWVQQQEKDAKSARLFRDGHRAEDFMAADLRMVPGIELITLDPDTGQQIMFIDKSGHILGHADGIITGLVQAPKTPHVWEHKSANEKKFRKLVELRAKLGEKNALAKWDAGYYAQAILYMYHSNLTRHYMTVSTPGLREVTSIRTNANNDLAELLIERGQRIVNYPEPPPRISEDQENCFNCKWCPFLGVCMGKRQPERNCRTCMHSTPEAGGEWSCRNTGELLSVDEQRKGSPGHRYIPALVPGEQTNAADDMSWIEYQLPDGSIWRDEGPD